MKNNRLGQVSVIALWILVILAIMAVSVGRRVSLGLRLSGYQRDSLRAVYLANAGLNRAVIELEKYQLQAYSALSESWSTGTDAAAKKSILKDVPIKANSGELFNAAVTDEEGKLNLNIPLQNNLPEPQFRQFLSRLISSRDKSVSQTESGEIADMLADWIDEDSVTVSGAPEDEIFKNKKLDLPEEFLIVLENYYQAKNFSQYREKARLVYNSIKDLVTVYGSGEINLNTVSPELLIVILEGIKSQDDALQVVSPEGLADKIIQFREKGIFDSKSANDIVSKLTASGTLVNEQESDCLSGLERYLCVKSRNYLIESSGYSGKVNKKITAVVNVENGLPVKIISWYQN